MSEKSYKVSVLARKPQFENYVDVINALYPKGDERATVSELEAKIQAHLGRRVK